MHPILRNRPARGLLATATLALLPQATLSIALLVHAARLTGSVAAAGLVSGAYALALGLGGPAAGRIADRRGQTGVLAASTAAAIGVLVAVALLPRGASIALLAALAAALGAATPPVAACLRAALPAALSDPAELRIAVAFQATLAELAWIAGPPFVLGIAAVVSTRAALLTAAGGVLAGTVAFARQPASRRWRPCADVARPRGGAMRAPGMRTLVAVLLAVGVVFGAVEVGIATGQGAGAGPLLGLWGAGSLLGGALATRLGGGARTPSGLAGVLTALTLGHLALAFTSGSAIALGLVLMVAGAAIAPTYAAVYAMVDDVAPDRTLTEASAWLATAVAVGAALGSASAGVVIEHAGPSAAFGLAGAAGAIAVAVTLTRAATLDACSARTTSTRSPACTVSAPVPG
jgi:MFS family permease